MSVGVAPLEVHETTVYALSMPKYIYIQLFGGQGADVPPPLKIKADQLEESKGGPTILKLNGQKVGEFHTGIAGWWIQDEP